MNWSKDTYKALDNWLRHDTFITEHDSDMSRFYSFMACVWCDTRDFWAEGSANVAIATRIKELHPNIADKAAEYAAEFVDRGSQILDFLTAIEDRGEIENLV